MVSIVIETKSTIETNQPNMEVETRVKILTKNIAVILITAEAIIIITSNNRTTTVTIAGGTRAAKTTITIEIETTAQKVATTTEISPIEAPTTTMVTTNAIIIKAEGENNTEFEK
jgi:hypothetical protein